MLEGILAILVCQLLGTLAVSLLHLPIPGPIVGMLLLLVALLLRRPRRDHPMLAAADRLLDVLPLLFIPAGVGVIAAFGQIRAHALTVGIGLVVPWVVGLLAAAGAALAARRFVTAPDDDLVASGPDLVADAEETEGLDHRRAGDDR